jgi:hypothetical protein
METRGGQGNLIETEEPTKEQFTNFHKGDNYGGWIIRRVEGRWWREIRRN